MIFQLGRYTIDVDVEKTKDFYASAVASNEICSCPCCQHFPNAIMSCSTIIVDFLNNLGIDPRKPGEVFGDKYNCSGWYHIVGTLLNGRVDGLVTFIGKQQNGKIMYDKDLGMQAAFDGLQNPTQLAERVESGGMIGAYVAWALAAFFVLLAVLGMRKKKEN